LPKLNIFLSFEQTTQEETGHHLIKTNYLTAKTLLVPSVPVVFSVFKLYIVYNIFSLVG